MLDPGGRYASFLILLSLTACTTADPVFADGTGGSSSQGGAGQGGGATSVGGASVGGSGGGGAECPNLADDACLASVPPPTCTPPEPPHPGEVGAFDSVSATLIDQQGNAAGSVQCTICGTNICSTPIDSDGAGAVTVDASSIASFEDPRFVLSHNGQLYGRLAGAIPTAPTHDFGQLRVLRLADFPESVPLVPGEESTQGGVTLSIPAGGMVVHDPISHPTEQQRGLRGVVADISAWPASELPAVCGALCAEVLVVVAPLNSTFCPAAELRFANVRGWPAGSAVDIYLNGSRTFDHYVPWGQWGLHSTATVSSDGSEVVTDSGQGIYIGGTYAVARH